MIRCRLFGLEEYRAQEQARGEAIDAYRKRTGIQDWNDELRAINRSFFPPGSMWFCPWYHDPADPEDEADRQLMLTKPDAFWLPGEARRSLLSKHYFHDWAHIRPPIVVVGPNWSHWCVDQRSSNGTGWTVRGEAPDLEVSPSIWLGQGKPDAYHGFLGSSGAPAGFFTANL